MKKNQLEAIKQLEAALLRVKRAGLVLAGIDDNLHATVEDAEFIDDCRRSSTCESMLVRNNTDHPLHRGVRHYGCYRDSGGA